MELTKKQQAVLYLEATRMFFYPGTGGAILQIAFSPDLIADLEVLNPQKFIENIVTFFQAQRIPPSDILLVFSASTVFEKEFPEGEKEEVIQHFIDYIPFDDVISKTFSLNKKLHTVAINGQLYILMKEACEKIGSAIVGVVPYSLLQGVLPELLQKVDMHLMFDRFDSCKQFSLIVPSAVRILEEKQKSPAQNKRVFVLLGVFGLLLLVLTVMIFMNMSTPPAPSTQAPRTLPIPSVVVTPTSATTSAQTSISVSQPQKIH